MTGDRRATVPARFRPRSTSIAVAIAFVITCLRPAHGFAVPAAVCGLFVISWWLRTTLHRHLPRAVSALALSFAAILTVATAWHRDPQGFKYLAVIVVIGGISLVWGSALRDAEFAIVSRVIIGIAVVASLYAVGEVLTGWPRIGAPMVTKNTYGQPVDLSNHLLGHGLDRAQVTFGQPLLLSLFILWAILLVVVAVRPLSVQLIVGSVLLLGLLMSGSRSVLVVLMVLLAWRMLHRHPRAAALLVVAICAAAAVLAISSHKFLTSGSWVHRVSALPAAGRLLTEQGWPEVLLGNGVYSAPRLGAEGLLQGDGFAPVDNQFVLTLAQGGVLGLLVMLALFVVAFRLANRDLRLLVVALVGMGLAFDLTMWWLAVAMLGLTFGMAVGTPSLSVCPARHNLAARSRSRLARRTLLASASATSLLIVAVIAGVLTTTQPAPVPAAKQGVAKDPLEKELSAALSRATWPHLNPSMKVAASEGATSLDLSDCALIPPASLEGCSRGDRHPEHTAVVVGDTTAVNLGMTLTDVFAQRSGWRIYLLGSYGCRFDSITVRNPVRHITRSCPRRVRAVVRQIRKLRPDVLFVANGYAPHAALGHSEPMTPHSVAGSELRVLRRAKAAAGKVVLLAAPPTGPDLKACRRGTGSPARCVAHDSPYWLATAHAQSTLAKKIGGLWLDTRPWLCTRRGCPAFAGGIPVRSGPDTLTSEYSARIAPVVDKSLVRAGVLSPR